MSAEAKLVINGDGNVIRFLDKVTRAQGKLQQSTRAAGVTSEKAGKRGTTAFNSMAITLRKAATAAVGVGSLAAAFRAIRSEIDAAREAGERFKEFAPGIGNLAQVTSDKFDLKALQNFTRQTFREGNVASQDASKQLVFNLASAGEDALRQRRFFSRLALIDDPVEISNKARKLQLALGKDETGSLQNITSKALAAAKPVSGTSASQVLTGAAVAGKEAGTFGLSDEEFLAAISVLSQTTDPGQAGTQVRSLLFSLEQKDVRKKIGLTDAIKRQGLGSSLEQVRKKFPDLTPGDLKELLGRKEAVSGVIGLIKGPSLSQRTADISRGNVRDFGIEAIQEAEGNRVVQDAIAKRAEAAAVTLDQEYSARLKTQKDIARSEGTRLNRARGRGPIQVGTSALLAGAADFAGLDAEAQRNIASGQSIFSDVGEGLKTYGKVARFAGRTYSDVRRRERIEEFGSLDAFGARKTFGRDELSPQQQALNKRNEVSEAAFAAEQAALRSSMSTFRGTIDNGSKALGTFFGGQGGLGPLPSGTDISDIPTD